MSVRLLILALVINTVFSAEKNTKCITPDYAIGTCVPINTCPELDDKVKKQNQNLTEFATESQCGFDGIPLVCCKASTYANLTSIYDKFFITVKPIMHPYFNVPGLADRTICGLGKQNLHLGSGNQTTEAAFPWLAALEYKFNGNDSSAGIRCDGTVIHSKYILTAAHCMDDEEFGLTHVQMGKWDDVESDCDSPLECANYIERIEVDKQIPHPFYNAETRNNDIGLLRLLHGILFSSYIRPICLPQANIPIPKNKDLITLVGRGRKGDGAELNTLLKLNVFLSSNETCKEFLETRRVSLNHLCLQTMEKVEPLKGSSGGSLMQIYTDTDTLQIYLEGVVLEGFSSGSTPFTASYTRVSKFIHWIIRHLSGKYKG